MSTVTLVVNNNNGILTESSVTRPARSGTLPIVVSVANGAFTASPAPYPTTND
jgi:hypothetical protein